MRFGAARQSLRKRLVVRGVLARCARRVEDDLRNFRIVIQYEGTRYQGWQRQGTTQNTLQGKFEALLSKIAGTPVEIQASARTDAGVHALGQTANFHMNTELSCEELLDKLNQYLPEDVAVISCQEAAPRFHARLNAVGKTYCYRIHNSKIPAVFDRRWYGRSNSS